MPECSMEGETCSFRCTGYDGSHIWSKMHKLAESIECDSCREHGEQLVSGLHDIVNVGLGKKPYDNYNLRKFVDEVNCAYNACKASGRCT